MKMQGYGDSNMGGTGATTPSLSWMGKAVPINSAVGGAQAADVSNLVTTNLAGERFCLNIGLNDLCVYKDNATKKVFFENFLRHCVAWLALPSRVLASSMITTGTWTATQAATASFGRNTTQQGATIKANVSGDKVFVGYLMQNHANALAAGDVYIDDVLVGSISSDGMTVPINTQNGASTFAFYANACKVFDVAPGTHEVKVVCTTSGKQLYVNFVAGNDQPIRTVRVGNIHRMTAAGYTTYGVTEATTDAYNAIIADVASELGVELIDIHEAIDPATHLADQLHFNNVGHSIVNNLCAP